MPRYGDLGARIEKLDVMVPEIVFEKIEKARGPISRSTFVYSMILKWYQTQE